ncbi:MAG: NAD-dependent epimerase/dehydratase family protein [Dissulfurimicrobium sp.]|uniref:NAD-dependent epimerase/dehydratase family protein n=1 Tax=Dissulfurimicrobium sp. TaxID=2022436 RepID=UPI00404B5F90
MAHILVTGANGFIGQALCRSLARQGIFVRRAVRRTLPEMAERPYELAVVGEIGPETDWSYALDGIDIVIHLAGKAHSLDGCRGQTNIFYRVNTHGTENLCKAAVSAGVKQFIYISTAKVHGETSGLRPFSEKDTPAPADDYARSKWLAEQAINAIASGSGMKAIILRPPMVYGPGMKGNLLRLLRLIDAGIPLPLLSIENKRSLLNVSNLVDILFRLIENPRSESITFLVSDREDMSTCEMVRLLAMALGKRPRLFPCRTDMLKLAARLLKREDDVGRLMSSFAVDSSLICRELNWSPPYSVWSGFKDVADWYKIRQNS